MLSPILPGRTVGIVGGGQLGRMLAMAARRLGYRVHVFDPVSDGPAGQLADREVCAPYDDVDEARRFAQDVDVVTFEFENIPAETLRVIAQDRPVRPSPEVLHVCRHRLREKDFLSRHGFPVTPYRAVSTPTELERALAELGTPAILKTANFGYDGKGQYRIQNATELPHAWQNFESGREPAGTPVPPFGGAGVSACPGTSASPSKETAAILEAFVPFTAEISVICARTADGQMRCHGPAENVHIRHILDMTTVPANLTAPAAQRAVDLACAITESLQVVGLLTVEMFVIGDNLLVNELAPRPHNSGHYSIDACLTSQFEQQLRAVCGLPLGDVAQLRPAAMANLLGDLWQHGEPNWASLLGFPGVKLHLYGKHDPRPGRKMGHITALADTVDKARELAVAARSALAKFS